MTALFYNQAAVRAPLPLGIFLTGARSPRRFQCGTSFTLYVYIGTQTQAHSRVILVRVRMLIIGGVVLNYFNATWSVSNTGNMAQ